MKFDVVVGNPPFNYNYIGCGGARPWIQITMNAVNSLKLDGYLCFVIPSTYRGDDHEILQLFRMYNLLYIQTELPSFPGINVMIDYVIMQKAEYDGITNICCEFIDIRDWPFIPTRSFDKIRPLLTANNTNTDTQCSRSRSAYGIYQGYIYETRKTFISKDKTTIYKYPVIYYIKKDSIKLLWSSVCDRGHYGIPKVIISFNSGESLIDMEGEYAVSQWNIFLPVASKDEARDIKRCLDSPEFRQVWKDMSWYKVYYPWTVFKYFKRDFWKYFIDGDMK